MATETTPTGAAAEQVANTSESEAKPLDTTPQQEVAQKPVVETTTAETEHEKLLKGVDDVLKPKTASGAAEESKDKAVVAPAVTDEPATDDKPAAVVVADEDDKLPFKDHPRFVALRDEAIAARERIAQFEQALPVLQDHSTRLSNLQNFVNKNSITGDEFEEGLRIMAALKNNPMEAQRLLAPHLKQLSVATGDGDLPDDISKRVIAGELSEDAGRELVRARTAAAIATQRADRAAAEQSQTQQTQAQQAAVQASTQAIIAWEAKVAKSDPDYAKKQELVTDLLRAEVASKGRPATPAEAVAMAQAAYEKANKYVLPAQPKATRPNPSSAASLPSKAAVVTKPANLLAGVNEALARVRR